ncbi:MAG: ABC transporter permease [Ilumatobacteraceae bacterium]
MTTALSAPSMTSPEGDDINHDSEPTFRVKRKLPPLGLLFGVTWLVVLTLVTILATYFPDLVPFIRSYDAKVTVGGRAKQYGMGPGWTAWFGTDASSKDVFARCIYGARITLLIGTGATAIGIIVGGGLGIISGYFRGWTDRIVSIVTDGLLALPALLLAMIMVTRLDALKGTIGWLSWADRTWQITITLGILAIAPLARIVRAQTISLREREFVLASRSLGAGKWRIMWKEIMPNLVPAMVTVAFTGLGILVAAEGALAFLGLSVERPQTWGKMIDAARDRIGDAWWATVFPCLMLFLTVFAFNLIGDEMARRFDIREAAV